MSRPPLILLAASTRFLAESALRAGFQPICFDLFADTDLDDVANVTRIESFAPEHLAIFYDTLAAYPHAPISYGGGIENFPDLIAQLEQTGRLAGTSASSVRMVRDLAVIARHAKQAGLLVPKSAKVMGELTIDRQWLIKPNHSAGGIGIRPFTPAPEPTDESTILPANHYAQERIAGVPASAIYWAKNDHSVARLGCTYQQVHGFPETFHYAGNRWALDLSPDALGRLDAFAHLLSTQCNLVGVFGVDFIVGTDRSEFYILEVNPRVPASMELFEPQLNAIELHLYSFGFDSPLSLDRINPRISQLDQAPGQSPACVCKQVLYAPQELVWTDRLQQHLEQPITFLHDGQTIVGQIRLADLPSKGQLHQVGWPVCTLLCFVAGSVTRSQPLIDGLANALAKRITSL